MKPSERIGNLLYNEKGEVVEVESITKTHINGDELSKWRPIPLTEELLKNTGFYIDERRPNKHVYVTEASGEYFDVLKRVENDYFTIRFRTYYDDVNFDNFKYVHQLQNLVYDLTQTDLKIKL